MPDSHISNLLGHGHVTRVWPSQCDDQGCSGLLRKVSLPHKRIQSRDGTVSADEHERVWVA